MALRAIKLNEDARPAQRDRQLWVASSGEFRMALRATQSDENGREPR